MFDNSQFSPSSHNTPLAAFSGPLSAASVVARPAAGGTLQGRQAAPLDNRAATLTPPPHGEDGAALLSSSSEPVQITRWRLKHCVADVLRKATPEGGKTPGVCKCGTAGRGENGEEVSSVEFWRKGNRPGISGVYYCDSPWLCPSCAPRRAAERVGRVHQVFDAVEKRKGQVVFLTLTVRHKRGDSLAALKKLVTEACRKARQGKPWRLAVERHNILGVLVGPEVTWSRKSGWHFHLHLAVPMIEKADADKSAEERAEEAGEWLIDRYLRYIRNEGGSVDRRYYEQEKGEPKALRKAQDVQVVWRKQDLAAYLAKGSGAWEVAAAGSTKSRTKDPRIGGMTPWDMAVMGSRGDAKAAERFLEYATVMPGTKSCVITKSLAEKLGLNPEDDREEPGVEEVEKEAEHVGYLEAPRWHKVLRRGFAADVLKAVADLKPWAEIDGLVRRLLDEQAVEHSPSIPPVKVHAPEPWELARQTSARALIEFRGNQGRALRAVLEEHRSIAAGKDIPFVQPPLSKVWEALCA